jgi:hypothetical protein
VIKSCESKLRLVTMATSSPVMAVMELVESRHAVTGASIATKAATTQTSMQATGATGNAGLRTVATSESTPAKVVTMATKSIAMDAPMHASSRAAAMVSSVRA